MSPILAASFPVSQFRFFALLLAASLMGCLSLTCKGDNEPITPGPDEYDPTRPTISSFVALRDGAPVQDSVVYSGEDIGLTVHATSHAFPASCGLSEDEVVTNNLLYTFNSLPPNGVDAPGVFSQATPPSNTAVWRVPNLSAYDTGEGLLYALRVTVFDECLSNESTGSITLRAFADQGPPEITATMVRSGINTSTTAIEEIDANGFYEVEKGDQCRISVTAASRTSPSVCLNRGVAEGDELEYVWSTTNTTVKLTFESNPTHADSAEFAVPASMSPGDTFPIQCRIEDACTETIATSSFNFIVVGAPRIENLSGTANGASLAFDPYFDDYLVLPGDKVILTATAEVLDQDLCESKGIHPDLSWKWEELSGSTPAIAPDFEPQPVPNDISTIEFVIPVATNGTQYAFQCTVTDRCNGLVDSEIARFLVIVPPTASLLSVQRNANVIQPNPANGRYEVQASDSIQIRAGGAAASTTTFCHERGISASPPVQYYWTNPWDLLTLNYQAVPATAYCDLMFIVPANAVPYDVNMHCRVKDLCNDLAVELTVPFRIVE
jgi:hypothetical protein